MLDNTQENIDNMMKNYYLLESSSFKACIASMDCSTPGAPPSAARPPRPPRLAPSVAGCLGLRGFRGLRGFLAFGAISGIGMEKPMGKCGPPSRAFGEQPSSSELEKL